jgi:carbamoyl-phosphate synthase large subunit
MEAEIRSKGLPTSAGVMRRLKAMGFSDARLGKLVGMPAETVREKRRAIGVRPVFKRIDTCAAEFASPTAYMYSTYETPFAGKPADEAAPSDKKKVVILGGGPNRIGQGIEFDYCCCHAAFALRDAGYETIMVNCRTRCRPTTTPRTGFISSRSPPKTCWRSSKPSGRKAPCTG